MLVLVPVMYSFFGTSARESLLDDDEGWEEPINQAGEQQAAAAEIAEEESPAVAAIS